MVEPINLNKARKAKKRADARVNAAENRVRFGRTRSEREQTEAERLRADRNLSGHRREDD